MLVNWCLNVHVILLGIIRNGGKYEKLEKYLFTTFVTFDLIVVITLGIAYMHAETFADQTWVLTILLPAFVNVIFRVLGYKRKTRLLSIIARFRFDSSYFPSNNAEENAYLIFEKNFGLAFRIFFSGMLLFEMVPYVRCFLASDVNYNNPDLYLIPHFLHFWNVRSFWEYVTLTILQNVIFGFGCFFCMSLLVFVAYVSSNINAHMKELNEQFNRLLDSNMAPIVSKGNRKSFVWINISTESREYESLYEGFMAILNYQQFLQIYIMDFIKYINLILSMYVIPCITIPFFAVLSINEMEGSAQIQIAMVLGCGICALYIWSYVGQAINDLNAYLQEMLYHTQWCMLPVEFRKLLVTSMILTHEEMKLTLFGIYKIDLEFYAKVLKALYSVANLVSLKRKSVN